MTKEMQAVLGVLSAAILLLLFALYALDRKHRAGCGGHCTRGEPVLIYATCICAEVPQ